MVWKKKTKEAEETKEPVEDESEEDGFVEQGPHRQNTFSVSLYCILQDRVIQITQRN